MNLSNAKYSIIDVETTGGVKQGRITEICIITIENRKVTDVYTSLVNPEALIPRNITALTGIDNFMVQDAPKFHEISAIIEGKTKDAIFVAHNVNFDFGFLKKEFEFLGKPFGRKKLCTVRLSRKLIPGLRSYSLGRLCNDVGISLKGAHRAEADTRATANLFLKLLTIDAQNEFNTFTSFLNKSSRQATLPPHISTDDFNKLPETTGVYLFKNKEGKVLYVGKAKNIKSRVLSHIYSKVQKSINMCVETHHLDFEETGNELCALLLEADYIRQYYPKYNKAQKRPVHTYQIITYTNQRGILQLALGKTKSTVNSVMTLYNKLSGIEKLTEICKTFNLCPKYCALLTNTGSCTHFEIKDCKGVCCGNEAVESYNERVQAALDSLNNQKLSYVIKEKGRTLGESAFILVTDNIYKGFGFIDSTETIGEFEDFSNYITKYKNSYHTSTLVNSYIKKLPDMNRIIFQNTGVII